ncbi:MAG: aminotransferase class IV [Bacteroidota bacterium]
MSLSTKSIFPLFESICVINGSPQNVEFHAKRFLDSFKKFYWQIPDYDLFEGISIPKEYQKGKVKLRISYNKDGKKHSLQPHIEKKIESLHVVIDNTIDYDLKFENRYPLDVLFQQKKDCDDILIVRNQWLTDSYYANIVFWDGTEWYTPNSYLLNGTKRSQLLKDGAIKEAPLQLRDLKGFQGFQLINAMMDFEPDIFKTIDNIKF